MIREGALIFDPQKLLCAGDLLHEAGHMAIMTPAERQACAGDAGPDGGAEMAALAWSYEAAVEIGLPPRDLFHAQGYEGGCDSIAENFEFGRYIGVPTLLWFGLTEEPGPGWNEIGQGCTDSSGVRPGGAGRGSRQAG
jgi:hypothetical protein